MTDALIFILGAASGAFATALLFCLPVLGSSGTPPIYNVTSSNQKVALDATQITR